MAAESEAAVRVLSAMEREQVSNALYSSLSLGAPRDLFLALPKRLRTCAERIERGMGALKEALRESGFTHDGAHRVARVAYEVDWLDTDEMDEYEVLELVGDWLKQARKERRQWLAAECDSAKDAFAWQFSKSLDEAARLSEDMSECPLQGRIDALHRKAVKEGLYDK